MTISSFSSTAREGTPAPAPTLSVSVVIESDNLAHAELDRLKRLLAELESQAAALQSQEAHASVRLSGPLDLVITYDCTNTREGPPIPPGKVRA